MQSPPLQSPPLQSPALAMNSNSLEWELIGLPNAIKKYRDNLHVVHCMLWFKTSKLQSHHLCFTLMQMRYDGLMGFPGGIVDEEVVDIEAIVDSLQRELKEEINYTDAVSESDYICSYYSKVKDMVSHFFAKQITRESAEQIERTHFLAKDFPSESLGIFRVPIGSSYESVYFRRFWDNFGHQKFSGDVRRQIIRTCEKLKIMAAADLEFIKSQL